jgi:hypothetical protein
MEEAPLDAALIGQVLEQAHDLLGMADSARAEAWVSSVLGLWREPGAPVDPEAADLQLLAALADEASPAALALALGMCEVGPDRTRSTARDVVQVLDGAEVSSPAWRAALGTSTPTRAWVIEDLVSGGRTVVIEFTAADGSHTMLAELEAGTLTGLSLGPSALELFSGLDEPGADSIQPEEVVAQIVGMEVGDGWRQALKRGVQPAESWIMNRAVALRRLESFGATDGLEQAIWAEPPDEVVAAVSSEDQTADRAARSVLHAALGELDMIPPFDAAVAAAALRSDLDSGKWPAAAIVAGGAVHDSGDDVETLMRAASAYVSARSLQMPDDDADALGALEWADWLGAVIGLVRAGLGSEVSPTGLVDHVNRCPEVSTAIPKQDREFFERAFAVVIESWRFCGFLDLDGRLTETGLWAIPRGLDASWSGELRG